MQHGCSNYDSEELPRYNLVMTDVRAGSPATVLRESMMAVTRQMRRHRPDHGLTLSQLEVLSEVSRTTRTRGAKQATRTRGAKQATRTRGAKQAGVSTPAEVA